MTSLIKDRLPCRRCGGEEYVEGDDGMVICPTCHGTGDATAAEVVAECRKTYGEAHDAHMEINGECPWCGTSTYNTPEENNGG